MYFKHLPIDFDETGRAYLRVTGQSDPFASSGNTLEEKARNREHVLEELARSKSVRQFKLDPITRASMGLALHTLIDFAQRRVLDARLQVALMRNYQPVLRGRVPSDAVHIASRACGVESGAQMLASLTMMEMICEVIPPPLAIIVRNLGACGEVVSQSLQHLFLLAGPDYSEAAVSRTSFALWSRAQQMVSPGAPVHGLRTIADIMRGLNPLVGHLYVEAWQQARSAREIMALLLGKYPHPTALFIGGVGVEVDKEFFNQVLGRVNRLIDFAKKVTAIWDDLVEFFYEAEPRYRRVGELPANLISAGMWDDPESYDGHYRNCNEWGERRLTTPGVIVNGELRTTRLTDLNLGLEEFANHAFYQAEQNLGVRADPLQSPLSPAHPWNQATIPQPVELDWKQKYSWVTGARWDREPLETGALARQWITALAGRAGGEFINPLGGATGGPGDSLSSLRSGLEVELPKFQLPATKMQWWAPERPNALERNRARAHQVAFTAMVAYGQLLKAFDYVRRGDTVMSARYRVPDKALGVGFGESSRGVVLHHGVLVEGRFRNYQINGPLHWLASPRDDFGIPSPLEAAVMHTPLLEECTRPEDLTGIDILRTIRSFDP